jgi:hypothetical protein
MEGGEGEGRELPAMTVTGARSFALVPPTKVSEIVPPVFVAFHAIGNTSPTLYSD